MAVQYVRLACSSCGKRLRARTALIGKKVKCPACGTKGRVPARMSSESSASFSKSELRRRDDKSFYKRWKSRAAGISHPEYLFLAPDFSPDSCVPCRGLTEWIAEAWRAGDLKSIARLIRRIIAGSNLPKRARDRLVILPYDMAGIEARAALKGLNGRQSSFLVAAYILQEVVSGTEEIGQVSIGGSELLAASVLPLRLNMVDLDEHIDRANHVLEDMQSNGSAKGLPPAFTRDEFEGDVAGMRENLRPVLKRLGFITTAARMHLMDALRACKKGYSKKPLEDCVSYRTRQLGCLLHKTTRELREGGYFTDRPAVGCLESLFKKKDLQEILTEAGVAFKKSARKADLWVLAVEHASSRLQDRAQSLGVVALSEAVYEKRDALLEYAAWMSRLLALWALGAVLPQFQSLQKPVEVASLSKATA